MARISFEEVGDVRTKSLDQKVDRGKHVCMCSLILFCKKSEDGNKRL